MKLYFFPPSPNVRKVNAVISHLGIDDIEREVVNVAKGEQKLPGFLAINPMGRLPALDAGGGLLLW
jgi:glutathione S-transferase